MSTITIRSTEEIERALAELTRAGDSRSTVIRQAILDAAREQRRVRLRAEAERLRGDPEDVAAARAEAAELGELSAW